MNASSGLLAGTPTQQGSFSFQVEAEDAATGTIGPSTTITVAPAAEHQSVTFTSSPPPDPVVGGSYTPAAPATSGLPATFTRCQLHGLHPFRRVVTFTTAGTCVIDANQGGNSSYDPAITEQSIAVTKYGLMLPDAVSSDGKHVWVVNGTSDSLTELAASSGARVAVIDGSTYHFADPDTVSSGGTHVWVANNAGNSVTELVASTGKLVRVISASKFAFNHPSSVSSDGTHVWVANPGANSVTDIDAASGALTKVISASSFGLDQPTSIAADGTHVWVANYTGNSVTELSSTGTLVHLLSAAKFGFDGPDGTSSDRTHV